jgi:hypothetical protein
MKTLIVILLLAYTSFELNAQSPVSPPVELKTPNGMPISTDAVLLTGAPTMLIFWKSTSNQCCDNLESLQSAWLDILKEKGVKMITVCEDCTGNWSHIKPLLAGKNWSFDTYIDVNGDFKRALNVNSLPCTILYDKNMHQLCRQNGFCSGAGELICEKIIVHLEEAKSSR